MQDDTAPDSKEQFNQELKRLTGYEVESFGGNVEKFSFRVTRRKDGWEITMTADSPHWELRKTK